MNDAVIDLPWKRSSSYSIDEWALTGFTDYVIFTADNRAD
jgi:hypothetical protein